MIEPLESRIAPAAVFTFTDVDGDKAKITTSLGTNADLAAAATVVGGQLRLLDLGAAVFQNANVTVSVIAKSAAGDGLVNVGRINAMARDLGNVIVAGDLGGIDAGDIDTATAALDLLSARSMGNYGFATLPSGADLRSVLQGGLGALRVTGDIKDASVFVNGAIGPIAIGGSLVGGTFQTNGLISATGDVGAVTIGRDMIGGSGSSTGAIQGGGKLASISIGGSVVGGPGTNSGQVFFTGDVGPVKIGGDLVGVGFQSGRIHSTAGKIGAVTIGGSVRAGDFESATIFAVTGIGALKIGGNVIGGPSESAQFSTVGKIASVSIGGSLLGGAGGFSGTIRADGDIGPVTIGRDVRGGAEDNSGKIDTGGRLASLTIGGSLLGGSGDQDTFIVNFVPHAGQVYARTEIGPVKIGGDIIGGSGTASGTIVAGHGNDAAIEIGTVTVGGSILGGTGNRSGGILSAGSLGAVSVGGSVAGGVGVSTGYVSANGAALTSITLGGSLIGGGTDVNETAGLIFSRGDMGAVVIRGDVLGGLGESSGRVSSFGTLASVSIGGSLVGGAGNSSGSIASNGAMGPVTIGHDLLGGSLPGQTASLFGSGSIISQERIGNIVIGGSIVSGIDGSGGGDLLNNATIRATRFIDSLTVRGGIVGNVTPNGDSPVIISAGGRVGDTTGLGPSEVAIGKISVGGRVEWAKVLAGFDRMLDPVNADAQIGPVTVGADWIASSLVAGSFNVGGDGAPGGGDDNVNFGNANDRLIDEATHNPNARARIGSITIAGHVFGTPETFRPADSFGFVAEEIGALKVGGRVVTLQPGAGNDGFTISRRIDNVLNDATVHEAGALFGFTLPGSAPPLLVNASTVTYADADGDRVTVKFSKPVLTPVNVNSVFDFSTTLIGDLTPVLQQLQSINVAGLQSNGLGITVTVAPGGSGDGLAHVGAIFSFGFDLGAVVVPGDVGQIAAGAGTAGKPGLASLDVRTLGRLGTDTQPPASAPNLEIKITGGLGALKVKQDIAGSMIDVTGAIASVTIGGSLIGGDSIGSGSILAQSTATAVGTIGAVKIGHHLQGGFGERSGSIVGQTIASASFGGSILGGAGMRSGRIDGNSELGAVKIGHNVRGGTSDATGQVVEAGKTITIGGSLLGGRGSSSGQLNTEGDIGAVKIGHNIFGGATNAGYIIALDLASITLGGSLIGGFGEESGAIETVRGSAVPDGDIVSVKIARDIIGGAGFESGRIFADGKLGSVTIGGSLLGSGTSSGAIGSAADTLAVKIGGNLAGGASKGSGVVFANAKLGAVTVGRSLVAGGNDGAGEIVSGAAMGAVAIGGNILGGVDSSAGAIDANGALASLKIGGSLVGGTAGATGFILTQGATGPIKIGGDLIGGSTSASGYINAGGPLASLKIGGTLFGGAGNLTGAVFTTEIGSVSIGRNIIGGSVAGAASLDGSGYIESNRRIGNVTIGGSLFAGWDTSTGTLQKSATIRTGDDLGAVVIRGSLHGNATSPVILSARGEDTPTATRDLAIKSVSISGRVDRAFILGGTSTDLDGVNGNAQLGPISVRGNWLASSVSAGVTAGGDGFGNANDALIAGAGAIVARIASIRIGGIVAGSDGAGDHFGFVAEAIGSFKSINFTASLTAGKDTIELSPTTADVTIREV